MGAQASSFSTIKCPNVKRTIVISSREGMRERQGKGEDGTFSLRGLALRGMNAGYSDSALWTDLPDLVQ